MKDTGMRLLVSLDRWQPWIKPAEGETDADAAAIGCRIVEVEREAYSDYLLALAQKICFEQDMVVLASKKG